MEAEEGDAQGSGFGGDLCAVFITEIPGHDSLAPIVDAFGDDFGGAVHDDALMGRLLVVDAEGDLGVTGDVGDLGDLELGRDPDEAIFVGIPDGRELGAALASVDAENADVFAVEKFP